MDYDPNTFAFLVDFQRQDVSEEDARAALRAAHEAIERTLDLPVPMPRLQRYDARYDSPTFYLP